MPARKERPRLIHRKPDATTVQPSQPVPGVALLESIRETAVVVSRGALSVDTDVVAKPDDVGELARVLRAAASVRCADCNQRKKR